MRYIAYIIFGALFAAFLWLLTEQSAAEKVEKTYCGPIVDKGKDEPAVSYDIVQDPVYYVVLRDKECRMAIRVNVTIATYYDLQVGQETCFTLTARQIRDYGNSYTSTHFK